MSHTKSKQFCALPWFSIQVDHESVLNPCCVYDHKSNDSKIPITNGEASINQYLKSIVPIKEKMLAGIDVKECSGCYKDETSGTFSSRQAANEYYRTDKSGDYYEKNLNHFNLFELDIKINNLCNYACAMCNPLNSSKIYTEWLDSLEVEHIKDFLSKNPGYLDTVKSCYNNKNTYEVFENLLNYPIKKLKISGGEPLMDPQLINILKSIDKVKKRGIDLCIITNGSKDIVKAIKEIGDFKNITILVSLEGIGKIQEYIRKHSNWKVVEKNILQWKEQTLKNKRYSLEINHVLQGMSIPNLDKLVKWSYNNNIPFKYSSIQEPEYTKHLTIDILNNNIIKDSISKLEKTESKEDWTKLLKNKYNKELHKEFLTWIKWYERNSTIKLIDIIPELYEI